MFIFIFYVIMTSKYVSFRQHSVVKELNQMQNNFNHCKSQYKKSIFVYKYFKLNEKVCRICHHLQVYAQFWTIFLTITFLHYISLQCYHLYCFLFVDDPFETKLIFGMTIIDVAALLFGFIGQCAQVGKNNAKIQVANRRLFVVFQKNQFQSANANFLLKVSKY